MILTIDGSNSISGGAIGYLGFLNREGLAKRMVKADIYISPSLNDPFSRTLSEAIACGCFVLSSIYDDASYDLVEPKVNALLFDPLNKNDFREKIRFVLSPQWRRPDRETIASSLRFTTEHYARQVADAICEAFGLL